MTEVLIVFPVSSLSEMKARYEEGSSIENTSQVFNLKKKFVILKKYATPKSGIGGREGIELWGPCEN